MIKFFMLTRGRTGSTAILDEIGTTSVYAQQELFLNCSVVNVELLKTYYQSELPFDFWKACLLGKGEQRWNEIFAASQANLDASAKQLCFDIKTLNDAMPFTQDNGRMARWKIEESLIDTYLHSFEQLALRGNKQGGIFKVLSNHLAERIPLASILLDRGYRALLLVRKNVVRQVLSGLIANSRGVYNQKGQIATFAPCLIDLDKFEARVKWGGKCIDNDRALLKRHGIDFLEISYEDFCENREKFYSEIFSFMGMDFELPKSTDFSIMAPDIRQAVTNFKELESRVLAMGMDSFILETLDMQESSAAKTSPCAGAN